LNTRIRGRTSFLTYFSKIPGAGVRSVGRSELSLLEFGVYFIPLKHKKLLIKNSIPEPEQFGALRDQNADQAGPGDEQQLPRVKPAEAEHVP